MVMVWGVAGEGVARAQIVARVEVAVTNSAPGRSETAFGRLAADALLEASGARAALLNAGALRAGTLEVGPIERSDLSALLAFGADEVVALELTGAQLRAALERGASTLPDSSPAFLHLGGLHARYDARAAIGGRVSTLRLDDASGPAPGDDEVVLVAMPVSLARGAAGYFSIWSGARITPTRVTLIEALLATVQRRGTVSPDPIERFAPAR